MRAVIQRVQKGRVSVDGRTVGEIGPGLVILLGVGHGDGRQEADRMADKIANLRIFADDEGNVYGSFPIGRIWKYDPKQDRIHDLRGTRLPLDPRATPRTSTLPGLPSFSTPCGSRGRSSSVRPGPSR